MTRPTLSSTELAKLWIPVVLWAFLIFHMSSIPHLRFLDSWWDLPFRKVGHAGIFGILARLLARAFTGSTFWSWKKIFWVSLLSTALYASSDEFHQRFTPGRHASPLDVMIDATGGWIALGFVP